MRFAGLFAAEEVETTDDDHRSSKDRPGAGNIIEQQIAKQNHPDQSGIEERCENGSRRGLVGLYENKMADAAKEPGGKKYDPTDRVRYGLPDHQADRRVDQGPDPRGQ